MSNNYFLFYIIIRLYSLDLGFQSEKKTNIYEVGLISLPFKKKGTYKFYFVSA